MSVLARVALGLLGGALLGGGAYVAHKQVKKIKAGKASQAVRVRDGQVIDSDGHAYSGA